MTNKEKLEKLSVLLGADVAKSILDGAQTLESIGVKAGLAYKAKKIMDEPAEDEPGEEPEYDEMDEQDIPETTASEDDESESEPEEEEEEETEKSVNLSVSELSELMAETLEAAIAPYEARQKSMQRDLSALQGTRTKERETLKNVQDELSAARSEIKSLKARLAKLEGGQPKATKGFVASESDETLTDMDNEALKSVGPRTEQNGFFDFVMGAPPR